MANKKIKHKDLKVGDYIYLDEDGTTRKKVLFGLFSKEVSKKSLYRVVGIEKYRDGILRISTRNVKQRNLREITVAPYWEVTLAKRRILDDKGAI